MMGVLIPRLVKLFFMVVLHAPLIHHLLSGRWTSLEFIGRKTGRAYHTPVAYHQEDDRVYITVIDRWWLNLRGGAPVRLMLRLHPRSGTSREVTDPDEAARRLRQILNDVPQLAYPGDVRIVNGEVSDQELHRALAAGRRIVEIQLHN